MMKEEASSSKKMPRKTRAPQLSTVAPSTPTKLGTNDEILTSLLRLNNFDSNIKDESLDIDLSACVTISGDSAAMLGHNSLSSTDFWRVLDESAQNSQLELTNASDDLQQQLMNASCLNDDGLDENSILDAAAAYELVKSNKMISGGKNYISITGPKVVGGVVIKEEKQEPNFSGTFLRPEAPPPTPSPIKRLMIKQQQHEQQRNAEQRYSPKAKIKRDLKDDINAVGAQSTYHLLRATQLDDAAVNNIQIIANKVMKYTPTTTTPSSINQVVVSNNNKTISSTSSFNIFTLPETNAPSCSNNNSSKSSGSSNNNHISSATNIPAKIGTSSNNNSKEVGASQEVGTSVPEPLFKCLNCDGLILQGRGEYATHEAIGHRIHYRCSVCDRDFEQEAGLKKHIKTHRSTDPRKDAWKKCPDCGKCLKLGSMWMHRKIHSDNKKYGCDICGQKFVQKINLTHHSRIHTAEKPYECPECQKRFQERSHLQRHQKYHAQTRSYRCEKCGKMYKTERCLKVHNLVHLEQRPFACTVCDKSFISNSKLKQHSNIHTGERPFKCNYCPRDFTNFPNWLKHTRRRHKVDHKTGEHLENIPSYCSKKSTKTAKAKAIDAGNTDTPQNPINAEVNNTLQKQDAKVGGEVSGATSATPKTSSVTKRKKKSPQPQQKPMTYATLTPPTPQPPPPPPLVSLSSDNRPLPTITVSTMSGIIKSEVTRSMNNIMTTIPLSMTPHLKPLTSGITTINKLSKVVETCKTAKPKRERKQPSPKQVQKATFPTPTLLSSIKREITEADVNNAKSNVNTAIIHADPRYAISNFPDLSITSAEELIMEQALEMEECGWNVGQAQQPSVALETDNAISSSEATAALHFKIKSEFDPMDLSATTRIKEEYITLKDMNQRLLCSSLESSPYSSPASVEMSAAPTIMSLTGQSGTDTDNLQSTSAPSSNAYNINPYALNTKNQKILTNLGNTLSHQTVAELQSMLPQITTQLVSTTQNQNSNVLPTTTTQAIINHFYLHPITAMSMPLLTQASSANQKLPSVDTLLFSAAAAAAAASATTSTNTSTTSSASLTQSRFFHGKSIASNASTPTTGTSTHRQPKLT